MEKEESVCVRESGSARKWKREQERDGSFGILQGTGCYGNREGSHLQREALLQQLASVAKWCCCRVMLVGGGWRGIKCVHKYLKWRGRRRAETKRGGWLGEKHVSSCLSWRRLMLIRRAGGAREQSKGCHTRQERANPLARTPHKYIHAHTHTDTDFGTMPFIHCFLCQYI